VNSKKGISGKDSHSQASKPLMEEVQVIKLVQAVAAAVVVDIDIFYRYSIKR
jgi:hypothetical protein